ncbi:MAG: tRNA lysidine(34) synthetase TilS [Firmicutes bacterium]|nr:tRNA lysidine(34) synthetase TilS [Bacillota bacterium]
MEKAFNSIKKNRLFKSGETVGIACSGGADSMALLHFLNANKDKLDIDIMVVHVDHATREFDARDAAFVADYCKQSGIKFYKFKVESAVLARQKGFSLEQACREGRYGLFESLLKRQLCDKIALAHHMGDQAETILLNILRGSGLKGAQGMEPLRDGVYARPFLDLTKQELLNYCYQNDVPFVEDETNSDNNFARNFLRNVILPEIRKQWPNADENLVAFGAIAKTDDEFINALMNFDAIIYGEQTVKIPLNYFVYQSSLVNRMLIRALAHLNAAGYESKHMVLLSDLAKNGSNGAKLNLPDKVTAYREYDYLTLTRKKVKEKIAEEYPFKLGQIKFNDYGKLKIKLAKPIEKPLSGLLIDAGKVPAEAVWRLRAEGDYITKFGGGTKKLKQFLIDKKVPARMRDMIPVLAVGSNVLAVAGVEISDSLKVDQASRRAAVVEYELFD